MAEYILQNCCVVTGLLQYCAKFYDLFLITRGGSAVCLKIKKSREFTSPAGIAARAYLLNKNPTLSPGYPSI